MILEQPGSGVLDVEVRDAGVALHCAVVIDEDGIFPHPLRHPDHRLLCLKGIVPRRQQQEDEREAMSNAVTNMIIEDAPEWPFSHPSSPTLRSQRDEHARNPGPSTPPFEGEDVTRVDVRWVRGRTADPASHIRLEVMGHRVA